MSKDRERAAAVFFFIASFQYDTQAGTSTVHYISRYRGQKVGRSYSKNAMFYYCLFVLPSWLFFFTPSIFWVASTMSWWRWTQKD